MTILPAFACAQSASGWACGALAFGRRGHYALPMLSIARAKRLARAMR